MGSRKKQTVGYRYYMGLHFGLCHGPVDEVQAVKIGDRCAWSGASISNSTINIDQPELFGGDKKEGGIVGSLNILMGGAGQGQNGYLASNIGAAIPAFRGILSAVWNGGQVSANNPYIKPWSFRVKRILQGWSTGAAWYPEKALIDKAMFESLDSYYGQIELLNTYTLSATSNAGTTSAVGILVGSLDATDVVYIDKPTDAASLAWSPYNVDAGNAQPWRNDFRITSSLGSVSYWENTLAATAADSHAIAVSNGTIEISGVNSFTLWIYDTPVNDNRGGITLRVRRRKKIPCAGTQHDMNPAHIVYECLTNTSWGMGYPAASIDAPSFTAAADTLFDEGFGLSMVWNRQDTIDSFIKTVLDHVGAILYVDPTTGKFSLKLIRNDYDRDTLPQFGPSNLVGASDYQRQAWGETINEITVVFVDGSTGKDSAVTMQDLANIQTQGGVVSQTRQYPGIRYANLAQRVAMRDLNAVSTPLAKVRITANRSAWNIIPGGVFRLSWPDYGVDDVVFRILEVNRGTLQDGTIQIDAVEDVFAMPSNTYVADQGGLWQDPTSDPAPAPYRKLVEAPYWDLALTLSAADLDYIDPLSGYLQTVAARPSGDALDYEINAKVGASEYDEKAIGQFCPTATISTAITKTTTAITFENGIDVDLLAVGGYAMIGGEYVGITAIDATAGTATITRGLLDTVPADQAAGARIWFSDGFLGVDETEYANGEQVDVKLLPRTGLGELPIASAPVDSITMAQRHNRPYPPGNVRVGGAAYPEWIGGTDALALTWAHRDRLTQTAYLVQQSEGNIGPEAGTSYTLRIYDENDILRRTQAAISGVSYTYLSATEIEDGGGVVGDSSFANVSLLLHMNGANGSTSFADSSQTPKTVTAFGNAQISTAQSKFGAASGLFDGSGDYLSSPHSADFSIQNTNFTIECWVRRSASGVLHYLLSKRPSSATLNGWEWRINATNALQFFHTGGSSLISSGTVPSGQWVHLATVRNGATVTHYIDGVASGSATFTNGTENTADTLKVGVDSTLAGGFNGYIDDLRITKGVARYTANFTPPAAEFWDQSAGDSRLNGRLRFELESVRGGLVSHQRHNHEVRRKGYGFNYGMNYGGQ